jgi:hypothetical protein
VCRYVQHRKAARAAGGFLPDVHWGSKGSHVEDMLSCTS